MKITKIKDVPNFYKDSIYEIEDDGKKVRVMIPWRSILEDQEWIRKHPDYKWTDTYGLNLVFQDSHYE